MPDTMKPEGKSSSQSAAPGDENRRDPPGQNPNPGERKPIRTIARIGCYTLLELRGTGGMGAVYKAHDENLNRDVALKVIRRELSSDPAVVAKFEREARITAAIHHSNVVKVFAFGSDRGLFYLVMELVDKGSLDDLISLQGRVSELQMLGIGIQVAEGLRAAHQTGLIHRDVKPGNILFADAQTAKIVDFGLAALVESETGQTEAAAPAAAGEPIEIWATPYYVAPEELDGEPEDFRSDIYSLGCTLFHAIAGKPPFDAETPTLVAMKRLEGPPPRLQTFAPDVFGATAFVVNRMIERDPEERYQSYDELIEHLNYARTQLLEKVATAGGGSRRVVIHGARQRTAVSMVMLGLIVLAIGLGAAAWIFRDEIFRASSATPRVAATETIAKQYETARKQMLASDFAGAYEAFARLDDAPELAQPLRNWITLHAGLSALLNGRLAEGLAAMKELYARGMYSTDPAQRELSNFFVEVGRLGGERMAIPATVSNNLNKTDYEALGLFLFALKDWESDRFGDAAALLAEFLASDPAPPFAWIAQYKPLAHRYAQHFAVFRELRAQAEYADTPEESAALDKQLTALRLQAPGRLAVKVAEMQEELRNGNPAAIAEKMQGAEDRISLEE